MAVDHEELQARLIASMAVVIVPRFHSSHLAQIVLDTDLVDLLLSRLHDIKSPELVEYIVHILLVSNMGHRKADQYAAFVGCLHEWKHEAPVLVRSMLAIATFARRAVDETTRGRHKQVLLTTLKSKTGRLLRTNTGDVVNLEFQPSESPPSWMPQDGSDLKEILLTVDRNLDNRRLQGASSEAIAALAKVSRLHSVLVVKQGLKRIVNASQRHEESQSIAINACRTLEALALDKSRTEPLIADTAVPYLCNLVKRHRKVPELISMAAAALALMNRRLIKHKESVENEDVIKTVVGIGFNNVEECDLATNSNCFFVAVAEPKEMASVRSMLAACHALKVPNKTLEMSKKNSKVSSVACKAIGCMVLNEPKSLKESVQLKTVQNVINSLERHPRSKVLVHEAFDALINLCDEPRNTTILDAKGMDIIINVRKSLNGGPG
eukprot:GHVN01058843.1.p2 GENE.GHVN01058843.1~~GHVN01058843.1.p2  ORF type:complete len:473 (-),score=46.47 GHVN01058843.1:2676-3989(-)